MSIPTPARQLSPRTTPEKNRPQPLSRNLIPEPEQCAEVSPTISSWFYSTSCTGSGSYSTKEVSFHVPLNPSVPTGLSMPSFLPFPATRSIMHDPDVNPYRWWAHWADAPFSLHLHWCYYFRLCPTGPHGPRPSHQMLASELPSHAWLLKDALVSLYRVKFSSTLLSLTSVYWITLCLTPLLTPESQRQKIPSEAWGDKVEIHNYFKRKI